MLLVSKAISCPVGGINISVVNLTRHMLSPAALPATPQVDLSPSLSHYAHFCVIFCLAYLFAHQSNGGVNVSGKKKRKTHTYEHLCPNSCLSRLSAGPADHSAFPLHLHPQKSGPCSGAMTSLFCSKNRC